VNRQNLQCLRVGYPNQSFNASLVASEDKQLLVHSLVAVNGTASANDVGIGHSLPYTELVVETSINSVVTDVTAQMQSGVTTTLLGTTNGDFFTVSSKDKFSMLTFVISQEENGSPVHTFEYWNGAWTTLPIQQMPNLSLGGISVLMFNSPVDWELDSGEMYSIKITATTAPGQALEIDGMKVCKVLAYREGILPKGELLLNFDTRQLLLQQGEQIVGFFAYASAANTMEASYQINP
jgi:hypothetical protein